MDIGKIGFQTIACLKIILAEAMWIAHRPLQTLIAVYGKVEHQEIKMR